MEVVRIGGGVRRRWLKAGSIAAELPNTRCHELADFACVKDAQAPTNQSSLLRVIYQQIVYLCLHEKVPSPAT
jgi:hypothetical protein